MISLPPPKGKVKACKLPENTGHDREEGEVKHFLLDMDLPAVFCSFIVCKNGFPQCELHDSGSMHKTETPQKRRRLLLSAAAACGTSSLISV